MSFTRLTALSIAAVCWAMPSNAQSVQVQFTGGLVSVSAQDAPVREILAEWARLGGTTFVNGDRVPGGPVTLQLDNVPERHALDVLLRSASGYMVAAREIPGSGVSNYDRILILPTSQPRPQSTAPAFTPPAVVQPFPQIAFDPDDPDDDLPGGIAPPDGPDNDRPPNPRVRVPFMPPNVNGRPMPPQPFQPDFDPEDEPDDEPAVPPSNPFGVPPGSSRPGMITPTPQQRDRQPQPEPGP